MEPKVAQAGLLKLVSPTREQVQSAFQRPDQQEVEYQYESYTRGASLAYLPYEPQDLEIIHSSDVHVSLGSTAHCANCDCHEDLSIEKRDSDWALNFAGYSYEKRCYVFRGQRRLLARFLDMAAVLFADKGVGTAMVRPRGLSVPLEGLNEGLGFEQFASYIKIVDCALFLDSAEDDPLRFDELTAEGESPMATQANTSGGSEAPNDELGARMPSEEGCRVDAAQQQTPETCNTTSGSSPSSSTERWHYSRYPLRKRKPSVSYRF